MKEEQKWEMPETARVYESHMLRSKEKEAKIPISEESMKIYEDLCSELQDKMKSFKDAEKKKEVQSKIKLLRFLIQYFDVS